MSENATSTGAGLPPFYRRRRFWRAALPVIAMAAAVLLGLGLYNAFYGSSGLSRTSIPLPPDPPMPKTVKFAPNEAHDVHGLVREFVQTAVARKNLADSYKLIGPGLREGISLKGWKNGQVTVVPYPVDATTAITWEKKPEWSYANSVRLQLHVITPDKPNQTKLMGTDTFYVDAIRRNNHWLVNNWVPRWTPPIPNGSG
jgi:hypothetical protein